MLFRSIPSDAVDFTPTKATGVNIACGSTSRVGIYRADTYFTGGTAGKPNPTGFADMSAVPLPAPHAVYLKERSGASFSYSITGLSKSAKYNLTLHFTEDKFNATGKRTFNVAVNGVGILSKFDIYSVAKAQSKAIAQTFAVKADATGVIKLDFAGVVGDAKVNAIQLSK